MMWLTDRGKIEKFAEVFTKIIYFSNLRKKEGSEAYLNDLREQINIISEGLEIYCDELYESIYQRSDISI